MAKKKSDKKSLTKKSKGEKIINKGNWFIVQIIDRLGPEKVSDKDHLYTVWGNWHLIKAKNAEKAYAKAEKLGHSFSYTFTNDKKQQMRWEFVGIGDLLPIYEDLEDKAEIMWYDFGDITLANARKLILNKKRHLRNIKPKKK